MGWIISKVMAGVAGLLSPRFASNWARHVTGYLGGIVTMLPGVAPEVVDQWAGPTEVIITGVFMLLISLVLSIGNAQKKDN